MLKNYKGKFSIQHLESAFGRSSSQKKTSNAKSISNLTFNIQKPTKRWSFSIQNLLNVKFPTRQQRRESARTMGNEDFDFDWEGLECDILRSISMKALKNAFKPCATNEVTNLGIFGEKTMLFLSRHSHLNSQLFSSLNFRICVATSSEGSFRAEVDPNSIF